VTLAGALGGYHKGLCVGATLSSLSNNQAALSAFIGEIMYVFFSVLFFQCTVCLLILG
jgi:hypothetical protein